MKEIIAQIRNLGIKVIALVDSPLIDLHALSSCALSPKLSCERERPHHIQTPRNTAPG